MKKIKKKYQGILNCLRHSMFHAPLTCSSHVITFMYAINVFKNLLFFFLINNISYCFKDISLWYLHIRKIKLSYIASNKMPNYYIFLFKCVKKFLSYMLINNVRSKWEILICEKLCLHNLQNPFQLFIESRKNCSEKEETVLL